MEFGKRLLPLPDDISVRLLAPSLEEESLGFWQSAQNGIMWENKGLNYQFKLINEAIMQKKALIKASTF